MGHKPLKRALTMFALVGAIVLSLPTPARAASTARTYCSCGWYAEYYPDETVTIQEAYGVESIPGLSDTLYKTATDIYCYCTAELCARCTALTAGKYLATLEPTTEPTTGSESEFTVDIPVTREAATFNVTVPTSLPLHVSTNGEVTTATNAKLVNNSGAPVYVKKVEINTVGDWTLAAYDEAGLPDADADSHMIGWQMSIGGETIQTTTSGSSATLVENKALYKGGMAMGKSGSADSECAVDYDAVLPSMTTPVSKTTVANVVFTVGWNIGKEITFTVREAENQTAISSYTALEGMTWEEFVNSDYNNGDFSIANNSVFHVYRYTVAHVDVYVANVSSSDVINPNKAYFVAYPNGKIYIYDETVSY